jgi:hypothetical protein
MSNVVSFMLGWRDACFQFNITPKLHQLILEFVRGPLIINNRQSSKEGIL